MAKTNAQHQAAWRERQKDRIKALERRVAELEAEGAASAPPPSRARAIGMGLPNEERRLQVLRDENAKLRTKLRLLEHERETAERDLRKQLAGARRLAVGRDGRNETLRGRAGVFTPMEYADIIKALNSEKRADLSDSELDEVLALMLGRRSVLVRSRTNPEVSKPKTRPEVQPAPTQAETSPPKPAPMPEASPTKSGMPGSLPQRLL